MTGCGKCANTALVRAAKIGILLSVHSMRFVLFLKTVAMILICLIDSMCSS